MLTLAEARAEAKRKLDLIANGEDPRETKQEAVRTASETVEVVARRFIERHAKVQTRAGGDRVADRARNPAAWASGRSSRIAKRDVVALLDAIVDRAPVTANRRSTVAKKMFNWGIERGLIEISPFDRDQEAGAGNEARSRARRFRAALIWRAAEESAIRSGRSSSS